jgi:hypothetical protein
MKALGPHFQLLLQILLLFVGFFFQLLKVFAFRINICISSLINAQLALKAPDGILNRTFSL